MIKANQTEPRLVEGEESGKKQPVCWNKDAYVQCLRVELGDGRFFILPYVHFAFADLERDGDADVLTASFTTHDLRIVGRNLRELGIALQKFAVDWVKAAPARYATLTTRDSVFIQTLEVKEAAAQALS
jgi:hypothetical protein